MDVFYLFSDMTGEIARVIDESFTVLQVAQDWSKEKQYENATCILECARVLLLRCETLSSEESFDCIKWLAVLSDSVDSYNLDIDVNKPFFEAVNKYLDKIYATIEEDVDKGLEVLTYVIEILFKLCKRVLGENIKLEKAGSCDIASLIETVPLILIKTFQQLHDLSSSRLVEWLKGAKDVMVTYFDVLEVVQFRLVFDDEMKHLDSTLKNLLTLQYILIKFDEEFAMLASSVYSNLLEKILTLEDRNIYQKETDKICQRLCENIEKNVSKLNFVNKMGLVCYSLSDKSEVVHLRHFIQLLSQVTPLPAWLGMEERRKGAKLLTLLSKRCRINLNLWRRSHCQDPVLGKSLWS